MQTAQENTPPQSICHILYLRHLQCAVDTDEPDGHHGSKALNMPVGGTWGTRIFLVLTLHRDFYLSGYYNWFVRGYNRIVHYS